MELQMKNHESNYVHNWYRMMRKTKKLENWRWCVYMNVYNIGVHEIRPHLSKLMKAHY